MHVAWKIFVRKSQNSLHFSQTKLTLQSCIMNTVAFLATVTNHNSAARIQRNFIMGFDSMHTHLSDLLAVYLKYSQKNLSLSETRTGFCFGKEHNLVLFCLAGVTTAVCRAGVRTSPNSNKRYARQYVFQG